MAGYRRASVPAPATDTRRRWNRALPAGVDEALQDGVGGGAVQLLVSDRLGEHLERVAVLGRGELARPHGADQAPEHRIRPGQVRESLLAHAAHFWHDGQ